MPLSLCKICSLTANNKLCTSLGATPICTECFMQRAETPMDLHSAALEAERTKRSIPSAIKAKITVWIGDGHYLPMAEWYRQNAQLPAIVDDVDVEGEEILVDVLDKIKSITDQEAFEACLPKIKPRKPGLFTTMKSRVISYFTIAFDINYHASI